MKRILPFKALRYNKNVVGNLGSVVAPPYDNISKDLQQKLHDRHPFNVVRLEYGLSSEKDSDGASKYTKSAEILDEWMHSGVILPDRQPSVYVCNQDFETDDGTLVSRKGIVCLVRLDEYEKGTIIPHLETIPKATTDRFNLMMACGASFNPVYALYSDPNGRIADIVSDVAAQAPDISLKSTDGVQHKVWQLSDSALISQLSENFENIKLFLADGHHRYMAALNYRNALRELNPDYTGNEPYNYVMMYLVSLSEPGLSLMPTHRMLKNIVGYNEQAAISQFSDNFDIVRIDTENLAASIEEKLSESTDIPSFAMYTGKDFYYMMRLKDFSAVDKDPADKSIALRHLDVSVLNSLVLNKGFALNDADLKNRSYIYYTRSIKDAVENVASGAFQCCFIMNPPKLSSVIDIAQGREKLPEKSTHFYPQLVTGLIMNKIN